MIVQLRPCSVSHPVMYEVCSYSYILEVATSVWRFNPVFTLGWWSDASIQHICLLFYNSYMTINRKQYNIHWTKFSHWICWCLGQTNRYFSILESGENSRHGGQSVAVVYKSNKVMHIMPAAEYRRNDNVIFSITLKLGMSFQPQESQCHLACTISGVLLPMNTCTRHEYHGVH